MNARDASGRSSLVGHRIGKFDVIAEIGTGGMASVYLARSTAAGGFNRLVAIKVMHPHLSQEDSFVEMFLDEARVAATIQHPNVVSIIDVGIEEGLIFLVMDYVEGDSFSNVEKMAVQLRRRIPLGIILRIVLDALAGLHYAHELCDHTGTPLRIIHRDVSPQNVMVGVDGTARIVDFGIAKAESRITNTQVGLIKGKLNFMAPEQIRGHGLDRRVDVFGMGVTLWEAVTLRRLFAGENEFDTARRILAGEYPSLRDYDAKLPPALDVICQHALHPDPDQRFHSAAAFAEAIETDLRGMIASPREVTAFISGVATQKLERERRALRESAVAHAPVAEPDDDDDEPAFMSNTVVEAPVRPPSAIGPASAVLPSSASPRDRSADENSTVRAPRLRPPTMSMPAPGSSGFNPGRPNARGVVVDGGEVGSSTRSLRVQPTPQAQRQPPAAGAHSEYDDDGATSPFHALALGAQGHALRASPIMPVGPTSRPPAPPQPAADDDDDGVETGAERTLFQPVYAAPIEAQRPQPGRPMPQGPAPSDRSLAIDLVQRREPHEIAQRPAAAMTAPSPPYAMHQQPAPGYGPADLFAPPQQAAPQAPAARERAGVPAAVYVLLSLVLVGGAAALLWYVLSLRNG